MLKERAQSRRRPGDYQPEPRHFTLNLYKNHSKTATPELSKTTVMNLSYNTDLTNTHSSNKESNNHEKDKIECPLNHQIEDSEDGQIIIYDDLNAINEKNINHLKGKDESTFKKTRFSSNTKGKIISDSDSESSDEPHMFNTTPVTPTLTDTTTTVATDDKDTNTNGMKIPDHSSDLNWIVDNKENNHLNNQNENLVVTNKKTKKRSFTLNLSPSSTLSKAKKDQFSTNTRKKATTESLSSNSILKNEFKPQCDHLHSSERLTRRKSRELGLEMKYKWGRKGIASSPSSSFTNMKRDCHSDNENLIINCNESQKNENKVLLASLEKVDAVIQIVNQVVEKKKQQDLQDSDIGINVFQSNYVNHRSNQTDFTSGKAKDWKQEGMDGFRYIVKRRLIKK